MEGGFGRGIRGAARLVTLAALSLPSLLPGCAAPAESPALPAPSATLAVESQAYFEEVTAEVGIDALHETGATGSLLTPEIMGCGVALFDYDGDGDLDAYLTNGNRALPGAAVAAGSPNRLFRQEADGRFTDQTATAGLGDESYGMGVAVGDIDNDGDLDVYLTHFGTNRLYRNRGNGTFDDVTARSGAGVEGWSASAAFFDYDRDGFLDLFVARYVRFDPARRCSDSAGRPEYCGPEVFTPDHDVLLRNRGNGSFEDVSRPSGIAAVAAAGLGVVCDDLNGDGLPDVYVANDAYANHLWINRGDGTFRDEALALGAAYNLHGQPEAGMGLIAEDLDHDGRIDLFVTNLSEESNTYYRNRGPAGFSDATGGAGLAASSMPFTGFGVAAFDIELDGDLDILVANGRVKRGTIRANSRVGAPWSSYAEPNLLYLGDGSGRFETFDDPEFSRPSEISRGLAVGDVDRDGDLDVLAGNLQGPLRLYRNIATRRGNWLAVRAIDPRLKRDAIGAHVTVAAAGREFLRRVGPGFGYLSSSDLSAHFGLGPAESFERVDVLWPDGRVERFPGGKTDRVLELRRGTGEARP